MWISARNQLKGTVSHIADGDVNAIVTIDLGPLSVKADITMEAVNALSLGEGKDVFAVIKANNVMFAVGNERIKGLSARNQLPGTVTSVLKGLVNGRVTIELDSGATVTGSITNEAIEELELAEGGKAIAIVKATDVMVGTED